MNKKAAKRGGLELPDIFRREYNKHSRHNGQYDHLDCHVIHQTAAFLDLCSHVMTSPRQRHRLMVAVKGAA